MKKLDWYIIRKYLTTFFFTVGLIIVIVIIFDISEKIENFIEKQAPLNEIIFDYYLTFIPFFTNAFAPLITFISVIYFTSRMAYNTEIIAVLSSGISYRRLLRPFIITSILIGAMSFLLINFVIPKTNVTRIDFENKYVNRPKHRLSHDIHLQNQVGEIIYTEGFDRVERRGRNFTFEKIDTAGMHYKIHATTIKYDTIELKWRLYDYWIRTLQEDGSDILEKGDEMEIELNVLPEDFRSEVKRAEVMDYVELNYFIESEKMKGSENVVFYEIEKHKRFSFPFSTILLTLIATSVSSRKVRGGIGLHLAIGLLLAFTYIVLLQISSVFAQNSNLSPIVAVWIPNIIYAVIAFYSLRFAQK
jgi:lipopolysaccharide export system permease protein